MLPGAALQAPPGGRHLPRRSGLLHPAWPAPALDGGAVLDSTAGHLRLRLQCVAVLHRGQLDARHLGVPTYISGVALAVIMAMIIFGGIRRIASIADILVPIMAFAYIAMALTVIGINFERVPEALTLIVRSAFGLEPAFAGGIGAAIIMGV